MQSHMHRMCFRNVHLNIETTRSWKDCCRFPLPCCKIILPCLLNRTDCNFKSFPQIFFNSVDEYIKKIDKSREISSEWSYNVQNLFSNVRNYITFEQINGNFAKILFDSNFFSIKNMEIKLEEFSKV